MLRKESLTYKQNFHRSVFSEFCSTYMFPRTNSYSQESNYTEDAHMLWKPN